MIIFRHHKGFLDEAMQTCKEFNNFEELQQYIVDYMKPHINLKTSDIVASNEKHLDNRIGWEDSDYVCIIGYDKVSDKEGFEKYFGGKYCNNLCIGMFATKYPKTTNPTQERKDVMTDLQILEHALYQLGINFDNINQKMIDITPKHDKRMYDSGYGNRITFGFDENGKLEGIIAVGEY